jgi:hypothetical protein
MVVANRFRVFRGGNGRRSTVYDSDVAGGIGGRLGAECMPAHDDEAETQLLRLLDMIEELTGGADAGNQPESRLGRAGEDRGGVREPPPDDRGGEERWMP